MQRDNSLTSLMGFSTIKQAQRDKYDHQDQIFYNQMVEEKCLLSLKIDSHFIDEEKKYAVYNIQVETSYVNYNVERRYSQFRCFFDQTQLLYKSIKMNEFPEKRIFYQLNEAVLQERQQNLNCFLQFMFKKIYTHNIYELFEFVDLAEIFKKSGFYHVVSNKAETVVSCVSDNNNKAKSQLILEKGIKHYIQNMNKNPLDKCDIINKLEKLLFNNHINVSAKMASYILKGEPDRKVKGLIQLLAGGDKNHFACEKGLLFLNKLLEPEFNNSSLEFQISLGQFDVNLLSSLELQNHVSDSQNKCKLPTFLFISNYLRQNYADFEGLLNVMLNGKTNAISQYQNWRNFLDVKQGSVFTSQIPPLVKVDSSQSTLLNLTEGFENSLSQSQRFSQQISQQEDTKDYLYRRTLSNNLLTVDDDQTKFVTVVDEDIGQGRVLRIKHSRGRLINIQMSFNKPINLEDIISNQSSWNKLYLSRTVLDQSQNLYINRYQWPQQYKILNFTYITKDDMQKDIFEQNQISEELSNKYSSLLSDEDKIGLVSLIWSTSSVDFLDNCLSINIKLLDKVAISYFSPFLLNERNQMKQSFLNLAEFINISNDK